MRRGSKCGGAASAEGQQVRRASLHVEHLVFMVATIDEPAIWHGCTGTCAKHPHTATQMQVNRPNGDQTSRATLVYWPSPTGPNGDQTSRATKDEMIHGRCLGWDQSLAKGRWVIHTQPWGRHTGMWKGEGRWVIHSLGVEAKECQDDQRHLLPTKHRI